MIVNYSSENVVKGKRSIFLAGPTPRSLDVISWRIEALKILDNLGFDGIVYVPELENDNRTFDYNNQVWWEREALYNANVIVFWIPRKKDKMPALTTNVEFGYWLSKESSKVIYGRPDDSESNRYLDWLYTVETNMDPTNDLKVLLANAIQLTNDLNNNFDF